MGPLKDDPLLSTIPETMGYKVLGPCVLYARVGSGGMGAVYRGHHVNLEVDVAVKVLKPELDAEGPQYAQRFENEARVAAQIQNDRLVRVYDVGSTHGRRYIVMEFVRGENLCERVARKGPLPIPEAAKIVREAAFGLSAAHEKGIVHRDIKPDNILISVAGEVKIADLGLAKRLGTSFTATNIAMGTPAYMAPEQWAGMKNVGPASDVWALGATLYFLLTGEKAYTGEVFTEFMIKICSADRFPDPRVLRPEIPESLCAVLAKATEKVLSDRLADGAALVAELDAWARSNGLTDQFLKDKHAGTGTLRCSSVTPPPAEVLVRVREDISGAHETKSKPTTESVRGRRHRALTALVPLLILCGVGIFYFRDRLWPKSDPVTEDPISIYEEGLRLLDDPTKLDIAIARFRQALTQRPDFSEARSRLAVALRRLAQEDLRKDTKDARLAAFRTLREAKTLESPVTEALSRLLSETEARVTADVRACLTIERPKNGSAQNSETVALDGEITHGGVTAVRVLRVGLPPVIADLAVRRFDATLTGLPEGQANLTLELLVGSDFVVTELLSFVVDRTKPTIEITEPQGDSERPYPIRVRGRVTDASVVEVTVEGASVPLDRDGVFTLELQAKQGSIAGSRRVVVQVRDAAGNESQETFDLRIRASEPNPKPPPEKDSLAVYAEASRLLEDPTKLQESVERFREALQLRPKFPEARSGLALALRRLAQVEIRKGTPEARLSGYRLLREASGVESTVSEPLKTAIAEIRTQIEADTLACLKIERPTAGAYLNAEVLVVEGEMSHAGVRAVQVRVADSQKDLITKADFAARRFDATLKGLPEGPLSLFLEFTLEDDLIVKSPLSLTLDRSKPALTITEPTSGLEVDLPVLVRGTVTDRSPLTLTVDGTPVTPDAKGAFTRSVGPTNEAPSPSRKIRVVAKDAAGNENDLTLDLRIRIPKKATLDWATVLEEEPDPKVVTDPAFLTKLKALDLPWRVRDNKSGIEMLLIAPGDYLRGSPETEVGRDPKDEGPVHSVKISEPFYVGRYEVKVAEWRAFVKDSNHRTEAETSGQGYTLKADASNWVQDKDASWTNPLPQQSSFKLLDAQPVVMVSWNDATAFTKWSKLRLLTEAEWEYVARSGTKTSRWFGDADSNASGCGNLRDASLANRFPSGNWDPRFPFDDGVDFLASVGSYRASPWGLHDVLGNVWEWCSDAYQEDEYRRYVKGVTDPKGPSEDTGFRVLRGGSWGDRPSAVRAAYRGRDAPSNSGGDVGFRVARALR